mgnify:CR=1 FL=1
MADAILTCLNCGFPLPEPSQAVTGPRQCTGCNAYYEIVTFPAMARPAEAGAPAENVLVEGESSCLYHPTKKASVVCDGCGAFLCTLCDFELGGQHVCPRCIARNNTEAVAVASSPEVTRYDSLAFHLALWPLVFALFCFPYFMLAAAPASLYFVIRYWNASRQPDGSPSTLMVAAAALAGMELLLMLAAAGFMVLALAGLAMA